MLVGDELPGVAHEHFHDVPLRRGEPDELVAAPRLLCDEVDREVGGREDCAAFGQNGPAHRGPQSSEQLVHAERLGHVVVGAEVERFDLCGLGAAP